MACLQWDAKAWASGLEGVPEVILGALGVDEANEPLEFLRGLTADQIEAKLEAAGLSGLKGALLAETAKLCSDEAQTVEEINMKFQTESSFSFSFGNLQTFFSGITGLVGPPRLIDNSLEKSLEVEHCKLEDAKITFTSSNGVTTESLTEWEFVYDPEDGKDYPDRFPEGDPRCRKPRSRKHLESLLQEINGELLAEGHVPLEFAELVAGILYTGPMYQKYNSVLRASSGDKYMVDQNVAICKTNAYPTTIHCINSCIIKLSKLTKACPLWRGTTNGALPDSFFVPDKFNIKVVKAALWHYRVL